MPFGDRKPLGGCVRSSRSFKNLSEEIVLAAVKQNGKVLVFAPEDLRRDREAWPVRQLH